MKAEIIAIGNEILIGKTLDTNSNWLVIELFKLGIEVRKISVISDEYNEISENIINALDKNTELIITTGGLGPSRDDITIEAISKSINQRLIFNNEAIEMVKQRYNELFISGAVDFPELNEPRKKMAKLPKNAIPIFNGIGAAPGMLLKVKKSVVFSMPGVPKEMRYIFNIGIKQVVNIYGKKNKLHIEEHVFNEKDETILAPILAKIEKMIPELTLKPLSENFDKNTKLKVRFILIKKPGYKKIIKNAINLIHEKLDQPTS